MKVSLVSCNPVPGLKDMLVPQRGHDGGDCGLADIAAPAPAVLRQHVVKAFYLTDPGQVIKLLAGMGKCSQMLLSTVTPRAANSSSTRFFNMAAHPPQPVLALVSHFTSAREQQPASIDATMAPLVTL